MSVSDWLIKRFPALARHGSVLKESWRHQDVREANAQPRTDHDFLPAALEIMEKPPSPGYRYLMLGLCSLFTIALLWSFIGKVDVVAVASGKVIPAGNVKVIQPIEIGYVRAIHVKNGQRVKAGELLVELDPTLTGAEASKASLELRSSEITEARNAALLAHLQGRSARFLPPEGMPADIAETHVNYVRTTIAEYEGERSGLIQQRAERSAELAGTEAELVKLTQTLPLIEQQLAARQELAEKGYFSKIRLLEYEQLKVEHVQNIEVQRANVAQARAAIHNIDAQLMRLRGTFGKTAVTEMAKAQEQLGLAREEVTKSARRMEFQALRAPVSGTVQQLSISTIGGVVQPAQTIMVLVPDEAPSIVEAQILNKDIGFVREGQKVNVKLEAFNFTDYGIIPGVVESISRDAIDMSEPGQGAVKDANGRPAKQGLVYAVRIRLLASKIRVLGRDRHIGPGLAVLAEIKTGERRIIDYLLSPIAKTVEEAGRER